MTPDAEFLDQNPLGKIPTLVLDDGTCLFDSRVIAAYLDDLAGGGVLLPGGAGRIDAMHFEALSDGIMDAIVLQVYERRWRTEDRREEKWMAHQRGKVSRGLAAAERRLDSSPPTAYIGDVSLACALGYLDLRFAGAWRINRPRLADWLDDFAARVPAFNRTRFQAPA